MKPAYGSINPTPADVEPENTIQPQKCSVNEATFNLITVLTGSGMLCLPFALANMGWMGVLVIIAMGGLFMYTYYLLKQSTDVYLSKFYLHQPRDSLPVVDYVTFGKLAFGKYGSSIVLIFFIAEMLLAVVSFLINISINVNSLFPWISVRFGIVSSSIITLVLSLQDMKLAAYASAFGIAMTLLLLVSLAASGYELTELANPANLAERQYVHAHILGAPLSVGLIAFCFGGHGTFPNIYQSMQEQSRFPEVLSYTFLSVTSLYLTIAILGYYFYAQYVLSPVTLNIGKDLQLNPLPYAYYLNVLSALGVVSNLQVTSPLLVFAVRDVFIKFTESTAANSPQKFTVGIVVIAMLAALTLRHDFAAVCAMIGSVATITNSIILPISFYHAVHKGEYATMKKMLHLLFLGIAVMFATSGFWAESSSIL